MLDFRLRSTLPDAILMPIPCSVVKFCRPATSTGFEALPRPRVACAVEPAVMCAAARGLIAAFLAAMVAAAATPPSEPAPTDNARGFFNSGTRRLGEGKLREAEALFESALATQEEKLQPPALYNLGHVRFGQGVEELKKGPAPAPTMARGRQAGQSADTAARGIDDAMARNEIDSMVEAYLRGRGARKELKSALAAVRRAMETHGTTLSKWQRALGDFQGACELKPANTDARHNAEVVERRIAGLVDSLRQLQQLADALSAKQRELGQKLSQIKGLIPEPKMPPGAAGDDEEEDDDKPKGPKPGDREGPGKEGEEISLSPEQAGWLLEGFKLDNERRLPMGQGQQGEPKDRNRPTW